MSRSVERFRAALAAAGLADTITELDAHARTAQQAAEALGCEVGQIVKSLVFADADGNPLLVLAAGDVRVDERRVGRLHGAPVSLGGAGFVREVSGYAIGGVPPFGHRRALPALVDRSLDRHARLWAAAGTPRHVFSLAPVELLATARGQWSEVGDPPA
ncbi:MAG: YbaK/EbsC family protein [Halofilum sp. (in: g-proteobacteria)]|nr:YbaK/EbsC family protein [Halofilum sp. (in: g-proteobacteria)]